MQTAQRIAREHGVLTRLPDLLKEQANAQPGAIAVVSGDQHLTYRDLIRSSTRVAAHLRSLGVVADTCVGLYMEPSPDLITGAWGILSAGGAYLPLSPEYPEDRLRYMIENSRTDVILTQPDLAERLSKLVPAGTRICTPDDADGITAAPDLALSPENLAYVIYTSGSTGRPKGVMIEHRGLVSQLRWLLACGHLGRDTTVLQKTPMSFDAAQWEILAPACGGRVVVGAPGSYRDPAQLIETIVEHGVTTLQCVPTLLQALLDTEELQRCTSLRRLFSGGETLSRRLARQVTDELPSALLVNLYGPTECTINATAHVVDPTAIGDDAGTVPIGVPVDNTQCFILDADMAPVDIGETGELYIGGAQLARGYLHRPDLTEQRFVSSQFVPAQRLFKTGDLAYRNPDRTIQFVGREDNQVKLRGHRVELDEIALAIEEHTWVRRAAAIVTDHPRTGSAHLVACVELNEKEAALMDQGRHGAHHQSKASKLQVKAQLSNPGLREPDELAARPTVDLPGREPTTIQRRETFARKTYRFYDSGTVRLADILDLLGPRESAAATGSPVGLADLTIIELGEMLRWFGQFHSDERLLPKYAYASPGALYATQLYLELSGIAGLGAGTYYYHPAEHRLVRVGPAPAADSVGPAMKVHLVGKKRAIEPVYKNNIQEVLEFEAGHMVGLFEEILLGYGLAIRPLGHSEAIRHALDVADEDYCLGAFEIRPNDGEPSEDPTELYVQAHQDKVRDLPTGLYRYAHGGLEFLSREIVMPKHVIAINQRVYERASFGIIAISRTAEPSLDFISLGRKLHHVQRNDLRLGFMAAGYSSKTGHPLPAARRIDDILASCGISSASSYFFLGGRVSEEQIRSEGMLEDTVHMKGPAEMIKDDLLSVLPDYMIPNRILVLDELPVNANGKVDHRALARTEEVRSADGALPYVAPTTRHELWLAEAWGEAMKYEAVSVEDDFFASGGNSLIAVQLVHRINQEFGTRLPLQVVFECPKLADLAARIENDSTAVSSRLVPLYDDGGDGRVFCWPGLGGYPMNLRPLARQAVTGGRFYGVQAHGINLGEEPYPTVREMATADVAEIRRVQPEGPYVLWGYSFGARVAFEAAWQLERLGERVANVLLICPGNPEIREGRSHGRTASYDNPAYVTILLSVFTGAIGGPELARCLAVVTDEDSFVSFVRGLHAPLDEPVIRRITRIVAQSYEFDYNFHELAERRINAPVTIFKAAGDDYSFIEGRSGYSVTPPTVVNLAGDHYGVLRTPGVTELASAICAHLRQ